MTHPKVEFSLSWTQGREELLANEHLCDPSPEDLVERPSPELRSIEPHRRKGQSRVERTEL